MAEPGPDCSSLLDEDLSSFVFSYLADSQVGSAGRGGSAARSPARCTGGGNGPTPPLLAGAPRGGEEPALPERGAGPGSSAGCPWVCGGPVLSAAAEPAARGAVRAPPGAPGRPQPRSPAGAFSTTRTWTPAPPVPPSAGSLGGTGDKLMGRWLRCRSSPPPVVRAPPKVGRGRRGGGGGSAGGCAVGADRAGLWDESCRASIPRIRAGILGDGGLGRGGATATGVSVLRVAGSKMWMGSVLDGAGY